MPKNSKKGESVYSIISIYRLPDLRNSVRPVKCGVFYVFHVMLQWRSPNKGGHLLQNHPQGEHLFEGVLNVRNMVLTDLHAKWL